MANYNFKEDLIEGEEGEKVIIRDLENIGLVHVRNNKDNKYDILMEKPYTGPKNCTVLPWIKYEIKTDVYCHPLFDTGNMFIEFECRGKPSGIEVTEAKWFVTYFKHFNEAWYIKVSDLKELIETNELPTVKNGGDAGSSTKGYLIPRNKFKEYFKVRKIPKEWLS